MRTSRNIAQRNDGFRSSNALTETEAAEHLGLSIATRAWRQRGKAPRFVRFGRAVRYLRADLDAFIRACAVDTQLVSASDGASNAGELRV
jgi:predicted DNA-binding transcriptional regulator AlpA